MSLLTDALIKEGLITREQLADARGKQMGAKKPLQELLVDMGFVTEDALIDAASKVLRMPAVDLDKESIDRAVLGLIPYETAKKYGVLPVRLDGEVLVLAMSDPQDIIALEDIQIKTKTRLRPLLARKGQIADHIEKAYQADENIYDLFKNFVGTPDMALVSPSKAFAVGAASAETSPAVKLVHLVICDAVHNRASDIHVEPQQHHVAVRYRVDGELRDVLKFPSSLLSGFVSRVKIMADLDIAETRKPQDGRVRIAIDRREMDLRISVVPTFHGEKLGVRILDPREAHLELDRIGFSGRERDTFAEALRRPQGMILVTGPTGSGKTSTLYAALNSLKLEHKNIMTIEDPVEYMVEGINQMQVNPLKDVTFGTALKSILRQDPDVVLVGEVRDKETAQMAVQSALTGHLVFSTLHTNGAVATVTRLIDIGVEPYLIASSLALVASQRLVRRICPACRTSYVPSPELLQAFGGLLEKSGIKEHVHGVGCAACQFTGYFGRMAIFELLRVDPVLSEMIAKDFSEKTLTEGALRAGMVPLIASGLEKVASGETTLMEVAEVVGLPVAKTMPPAAPSGKKRILVADDEEDILKVEVWHLEKAGYHVIRARDGAELVEKAVREKPDMIISDVTMPKMTGFEATRALRSRLETASIPILLLTARSDKESELEGLDAGADDYMTKPFDIEKLLARVKILLRRVARPEGA